ncbi:MAG: hypothetical protein ABIG95_00595 [Candidatus Woesearchaeota archaeon]
MEAKAKYLFEASWEVCNKVGGIYTVVISKVRPLLEVYDNNYFLIGPYFVQKATGEFQEKLAPDNFAKIFGKLEQEGIICHFGKWLIPGEPQTILIDFSAFQGNKNSIKRELWDNFQIDSLNSGFFSFDEPVIWAYAVGKLLEEFAQTTTEKIVAQFHEWLSGSALLYLKSRQVKIGTVFTTHATMLGRTIAGNSMDLYNMLGKIDPKQMAYQLGTPDKFLMEEQCALNADAFTTVSEITGVEAEALLGKKPDIILPNGLDIEKFPTIEESSIKHSKLKEKIKHFLMYYFFPYYSFNLDNTLLYFIAGRYEFRDKGIDVFIKALSEVNSKLKAENSTKTIVTFIWIPGNIRSIKQELLENKTRFEDIADNLNDDIDQIQHRILYGLLAQQSMDRNFIFGEDEVQQYKRKVLKLKQPSQNAPLCTHNLNDEDNDPIIKTCRQNGLLNRPDDRVKVVFYPIYLTGADNLLDLSYYEAMMGSHLGVFPSYYEPWGYTPLESGALGIASVTTDLSGFGRFLMSKAPPSDYPGIFVLKRLGKTEDQVVRELAGILYDYSKLNKQGRIENKIQAKKLASYADWKIMINNYIIAQNMAVDKQWS